jgi:hypothetical protein
LFLRKIDNGSHGDIVARYQSAVKPVAGTLGFTKNIREIDAIRSSVLCNREQMKCPRNIRKARK